MPTRVQIPALDVDASVSPYTVEDAAEGENLQTGERCLSDGKIVCIDPPTFTDVFWMQGGVGGVDYGDAPGTTSQGNVYLFGHASSEQPAVFTNLYQLTAGAEVNVTTDKGVLTYEVEQVVTVPKSDFTTEPLALEQRPGRLLLVTCNYAPGATFRNDSSTENVLVVAHLSRARST